MKVIVLTVLLLLVGESYALICVCSGEDCQQGICEGEICFTQAVQNPEDGSVLYHHRCLPSYEGYQCSSSSAECCHRDDRCNEHLNPTLPESPDVVEQTGPTENTPEETSTTEPTTEGTTEVASPTEPTTETASANTNPPVTAAAGIFCVEGTSDSPQLTPDTCFTTTGCYFTERRHPDGTMSFMRGCISPNRPCVPEDRKRKRKVCCSSNMCNRDDDLAPGISIDPNPNNTRQASTAPPTHPTLPPSNTTKNISTPEPDPHAPDINVGNQTKPEPSPRATTTPTIDTLEPSIRPPITTDAQFISCYCDTCPWSYCTTSTHCVTEYTDHGEYRTCGTDITICQGGPVPDGIVCCTSDWCNIPPLPEMTEEPGTSATAVEETSTFEILPTPNLIIATTTTNQILQATNIAQSEGLSIYYYLTGVVIVTFAIISLVTAVVCIGLIVHHRKVMRKIKKKPTAVPTNQRDNERTPTPTNSTTVHEESV